MMFLITGCWGAFVLDNPNMYTYIYISCIVHIYTYIIIYIMSMYVYIYIISVYIYKYIQIYSMYIYIYICMLSRQTNLHVPNCPFCTSRSTSGPVWIHQVSACVSTRMVAGAPHTGDLERLQQKHGCHPEKLA